MHRKTLVPIVLLSLLVPACGSTAAIPGDEPGGEESDRQDPGVAVEEPEESADGAELGEGAAGLAGARSNIIEEITERTVRNPGECSSIESVSSPVRAGKVAYKHVIKNCGKRSEFEQRRVANGGTYWYGFSLRHERTPAVPNNKFTVLTQWFIGGRPARSWPCGGAGHKIGYRAGRMSFDLQHSTSGGDAISCKQFVLSEDPLGKWVDVVMNAKWTSNTDGFLKLWVREAGGRWVQKINYTGRTQAVSDRGPYFKMGAYVGGEGSGDRLVYTDEYRLGNSNATFADVSPDGSTP